MRVGTLLKIWLLTLFFGTIATYLIILFLLTTDINNLDSFVKNIQESLGYSLLTLLYSIAFSFPVILILCIFNYIKARNNRLSFEQHLNLYLLLSAIDIIISFVLVQSFGFLSVIYLVVGLIFTFRNKTEVVE